MSGPETRGKYFGREEILAGRLDALVRDAPRDPSVRIKTVAERTAAKRAMLDQVAPGEDVWLFGYGSLIWNPAFRYDERRVGRIHGFHRRFSFWTTIGRGTPELPGMMLALEPGGSCTGVVFRVAAEAADGELQSVFLREMLTGSYHARWMRARTDSGPVRAIAFVANGAHRNHAGRVPPEIVARHIAEAEGRLGPCRDYLINTVRHLEALGIHDRPMTRLLALVQARRPD